MKSFLMYWSELNPFCELYPVSAVCNELLWHTLGEKITNFLSLTQVDCTIQIQANSRFAIRILKFV